MDEKRGERRKVRRQEGRRMVASKLPPMGGFMPSSRLELRQWLVYTAHSPEDFASEPSSLESLITGNLPAQLSITLAIKYLKATHPPPV